MPRKIYSEEELRALSNETTPAAAIELLLAFAQRITLALEAIAENTTPIVEERLFRAGDEPSNDGLGVIKKEKSA